VSAGSGNQHVAPTTNDRNDQRSIAAPEARKNATVKSTDSVQTSIKSTGSVTNSVEPAQH